ncbi:MAG TPA: GapA-binding peptide SR1P [Bacillota bacterium]|nr:GapA-binding peptide SR1P [Bacillota bacterium]
MGIMICQMCQEVIEYFDDEKVTTLYSKCRVCEK